MVRELQFQLEITAYMMYYRENTENTIFIKNSPWKTFLQNKKWTFLKCPFSKIKNTFQ
jgi:hypothetical protein